MSEFPAECDVCGRDSLTLQWAADGTGDLLCEACAAFFNDPERQVEKALDAELEQATRRVKARARISLLRLLDRRELQLRERAVGRARAKMGLRLLGFVAFSALSLGEPEPEVDPKDLN